MSHLDRIFELVSKINVKDVHQFAHMFMYQGFNPEQVVEHIHKIREEKKIGDAEFGTDLTMMILMGLMMGNYNTNNSKKISEEGKTKGDSIMVKYNLKSGSLDGDKRAVNIPRIMATFAIFTSKLSVQISPKDYGGELGAHALPQCMKVTVFASLIPKRMDSEIIIALCALFTAYTTEQTIAISREKDAVKAWNNQSKFTDISHKSSVPKEEERHNHFKTLKFSYSAFEHVQKKLMDVIKIKIALPSKEEFIKAGVKF